MSSIDGRDSPQRKLPSAKGYGCSGHRGSVEPSETMFPKSALFRDAY
jgi:hypothetical protein